MAVFSLIKVLVFYLLLGFLPQAQAQSQPQPYDIKITSLSLPINHISQEKNTLYIKIPNSFIPIKTLAQAEKEGFFQFVPLGEDANSWSAHIALHTFKDIQTMVETNFVDFVKFQCLQRAQSKVLEENTEAMEKYTKRALGMTYQDKGRQEVVYMVYYFGPKDFAGIQFAKVLKDQETPEQALLGLKDFVNNHIQVINAQEAQQLNIVI